jgi:hypothetical protein
MKPFVLLALPLSAGFVFGQGKITLNGTLVDAACQNTRVTQSRETNGQRTVTTTEAKTETADCPVTASTSSFGILTSDGRFIRFDNPSNARVVGIVRGNQTFTQAPMHVTLVGTANGDVAVVESLTPDGISAERVGTTGDVSFDVRYKDDRGKLVVGEKALTFEDISNAKRSQTWTYSQIKEVKRDGNELKINPYKGDEEEFHLQGSAMSETVYQSIANRIVAARAR